MSEYLLTWNPKHFSTGGEGSESGTLDYISGQNIRWSCHSQKPQVGDTVYLIRVGVEPRGIVAKGVVTKGSYLAEHWSDESKQKRYIEFKLEELRSSCKQGLLPMMLLQGAMPEQKWSPQTSGIEIKPAYRDLLAELWNKGSAKHSIEQFFNWYLNNKFKTQGWYEGYVETCKLAKLIQESKEVTEADVKRLWYDASNGIAGVGQGFMYKKELEVNTEYLQRLTVRILNAPTEETYKAVIRDWKELKSFKRVLWGVIHRVFAAAAPEQYTSIVAPDYIREVFSCLKQQYQIDIERQTSWLADNTCLLGATRSYLPSSIDAQTRNILLWSLYEWKATGANEEQEEVPQVKDGEAGYEVEQQMNKSELRPTNQIFYGPPGTGKTYLLQQALANYTSPAEILDREVWLKAKLEPLNWMQVLTLCLVDIGEKSKVKQLINHEYFQCKAILNNRDKNLANTAWAALQSFTVLNSKTVDYKSHSEPAIFDKTEDAFWFIVEEKLELVEELVSLSKELKAGPQSAEVIERFSTTTFHQSYGYEEFIEGLKAKSDDEGNIHYSVEPGAFLQLCRRASNDPEHKYAFFIDEINRGNISKIFGELITLIEADKRAGCKQAMSVKLAYSGTDFSVPANVDIIGTMNTADRSLALMDTALRRRFDFVEMMPDYAVLNTYGTLKHSSGEVDLAELLKVMNQRIEVLYDREHMLGHAFFIPVAQLIKANKPEQALIELKNVFKNKVLPLLQEYFFEDWNRIRLVLGDNQKAEKKCLIDVTSNSFEVIFGNNHGLGNYERASETYQVSSFDIEGSVWDKAESYRLIYQPKPLQPADDKQDE